MGFDIRVPIGFLFTTLGAFLVLFGLITINSPIYSQSLGMNINLGWGFVLLIFGLLMVFFSRRAKRREAAQPASSANGGGH
jgi:membrane protein implicated in regulation of membrane protease activity